MNQITQQTMGSCVLHAFLNAYEYVTGKTPMDNRQIHSFYSAYDDDREGMRTKDVLRLLHQGVLTEYPIKKYWKVYHEHWLNGKLKRKKKGAFKRICKIANTGRYGLILGYKIRKGKPKIKLDRKKNLIAKVGKKRGFHAMAIIGSTTDSKLMIENSWGYDWGAGGVAFLSEEVFDTEVISVYMFKV